MSLYTRCIATRAKESRPMQCCFAHGTAVSQTQPKSNHIFDSRQLRGGESSQSSYQLGVRNGDKILRVENAGAQEVCFDADLKSRTAGAGRVRDERCQRPILIERRDTESETRSNFRRIAEINQPHLSAIGVSHLRLLCGLVRGEAPRRSARVLRRTRPANRS